MIAKVFVDTNVWIYAHLDKSSDARCRVATELVESLTPTISTQILGEYYNVMRRNGVDDDWIQSNGEAMMRRCIVESVSVDTVRRAYQVRAQYGFSYWDCVVVASALNAGCGVLYTEDLQHGQSIEGNLQVLNPFMG